MFKNGFLFGCLMGLCSIAEVGAVSLRWNPVNTYMMQSAIAKVRSSEQVAFLISVGAAGGWWDYPKNSATKSNGQMQQSNPIAKNVVTKTIILHKKGTWADAALIWGVTLVIGVVILMYPYR